MSPHRRVAASLRFRAAPLVRHPVLLAARRARALRRVPEQDGRITVVVVCWNHERYIGIVCHALQQAGIDLADVLVVDNGSSDRTVAVAQRRGVSRVLRLHTNVGHGAALDIAMTKVTTEFAVILDPDAFPLSAGWVDALCTPLREGALVSGVRAHRPYAHPCCLAIRTADFLRRGETFQPQLEHGELGVDAWDSGELISMRAGERVHLISLSETIHPAGVGLVWEGVAYHNSYSSRHRRSFGEQDGSLDGGVTRGITQEVWRASCQRFLGLDEGRLEELSSIS